MSTTNDEQAKYGTERAPMLDISALLESLDIWDNDCALVAVKCRDHYESLITNGVLRVAKKVEFDNGTCEECGTPEQVMSDCELDKFCPGCGSEIVKP